MSTLSVRFRSFPEHVYLSFSRHLTFGIESFILFVTQAASLMDSM